MPEGLEYIGDSAFFKSVNLLEVTIPKSVEHLGKWVFHGCNRLKTITIAHDPKEIGDWIINKSTIVRCYKNSSVDKYCKKFEFKTEYL